MGCTLLLLSIFKGQTDGQTSDRYTDPALHTMGQRQQAADKNETE